MITYKSLENVEIEKNEEGFIMQGSGKLLKIFIEFEENIGTEVNVKILTTEGEEVLNINNEKNTRLFYPKNKNFEEKKEDTIMQEGSLWDYYYFTGGLLIFVKVNKEDFKGKVIKILKIIYEE